MKGIAEAVQVMLVLLVRRMVEIAKKKVIETTKAVMIEIAISETGVETKAVMIEIVIAETRVETKAVMIEIAETGVETKALMAEASMIEIAKAVTTPCAMRSKTRAMTIGSHGCQ